MEVKRMRRLSPSLREKKRYLVFEVISNSGLTFKEISTAVWASVNEFMGASGASKAGIWLLADKWEPKLQRGIIKVSNKQVAGLRVCLALINKAGRKKTIVRSIGLSGILNKAETRMRTYPQYTIQSAKNNKGDKNFINNTGCQTNNSCEKVIQHG